MVEGVASRRWVCCAATDTPAARLAAAAPDTINLRMGALLEEVVERLLGARGTGCRGGGRGLRFALDGRARLEVRAFVPRVLRGHAGGNRPLALEGGAGIEVGALRACVQVRRTPRALPGGAPGNGHRQLVAATRAFHDFAEAGHAEGLGRERRLAARRVFLLRLFGLALARLARLILVAALPVLAVRHVERWDCI